MKSIEGLTAEEERVAGVFRALGNPARIRIVGELAKHDECMTSELVDVLPLAQSTVSEHLRVLRDAGVVRGAIEGDRCYCLDHATLDQIIAFCQDLKQKAAACAAEDCCSEAGSVSLVTVGSL